MGPLVLHTPASAHGAEVDPYEYNVDLNFIVQANNQVLLYYFAFKYRGKDRKALYFADNNKLEALGVLFLPSLANIIRSLCLDEYYVYRRRG
jgi:hypothetical protein